MAGFLLEFAILGVVYVIVKTIERKSREVRLTAREVQTQNLEYIYTHTGWVLAKEGIWMFYVKEAESIKGKIPQQNIDHIGYDPEDDSMFIVETKGNLHLVQHILCEAA